IPAGLEAKAFMDRGELVPDEIVVDVVEERFSNPAEVEHGFVLDGFPRTENQAEELDRILGASNPLDLVVDLDVPTDMAIERLLGRGREDDNGESIRRRLELYEQETKPLIDLYRKRGLLVQVDGVGEEDEVFKRLLDAIDARGAII
ncbi:MAG: adenylate kinase family protein, partial [Acidimicrobiia bacterium]